MTRMNDDPPGIPMQVDQPNILSVGEQAQSLIVLEAHICIVREQARRTMGDLDQRVSAGQEQLDRAQANVDMADRAEQAARAELAAYRQHQEKGKLVRELDQVRAELANHTTTVWAANKFGAAIAFDDEQAVRLAAYN